MSGVDMLKRLAKTIIGECNVGRLEFFLKSNLQSGFKGPFNGQGFRQRIFFDLLYEFPRTAIVETGTFRGTTTALFGATGLQVYSCELHPRFYCYSRVRFLLNGSNISVFKRDSRTFLKELAGDNLVAKENVFFYLDAHWGEDLPLLDELDIIFSKWVNPIVMIDDFQVPDSNYKFDDYGDGKTLSIEYIHSVIKRHNLAVFFPAVDATKEQGWRRGSVVICNIETGQRVCEEVKTLTNYVV